MGNRGRINITGASMRRDMEHVIIDTARIGSRNIKYKSTRRSRRNPKDLTKEGMRPKKQGWYSKDQRDRLSPMYRSLRSKVGELWDDIYSDICSKTDPRNIRGYHLRDHIKDLVYLKSSRGEDGKVYIQGASYRDYILPLEEVIPYNEIMYVDPKGILRVRLPVYSRTKYLRRHTVNIPKWLKEIKGRWYAKAAEIWYEVEFKKIPKPMKVEGNFFHPKYRDILLKEDLSYYNSIQIYGKAQQCIGKRQLNKKDLRKLKLKNGI